MVGFVIFLLFLLFWEILGIVVTVRFVVLRVKKRIENIEPGRSFWKKQNPVQAYKDALAAKELLEKLNSSSAPVTDQAASADQADVTGQE